MTTNNNHHHTTHTHNHNHNHHNPLMIDQEIERLNTKLCSEQSSASPSASTLFLIHHDLMILHYLKRKNSHHHNNHNNSTTNTSKKKKKKKKQQQQQQQQTVLQNNVISENKKHETEDDRQYDESSSSSSLLLEEETLYNHLTSLKSKYSSHSNNNNGNNNNSNNSNSSQVKRDDLDHHPILMYNQALLHFIFQRYANVIDCLFPIFEQFQSKLIPPHETTNNINNNNNNNSNSSKSNKSDHVNSNNSSNSGSNNVGDFNSTSCVLLEKYEEFYVLKICFLLLDCLLSQCVMESESRRMAHEIIEYLNIVFRSTLVMDYYTKPTTTVNTGGGSRLGKATNAAPFQYFSVAESKFWLHIYRMRYYLFVSDVESACVEFKIIAQLFVHRVSNAGNTDVIHAQHLSPCKKDVITSLMQAKILIEKYKQSPLNKQSDIISKCVQLMNHMRPQVLPMVYYNNMAYMHMREHLDQVNLSHSKTTTPSNEYSNTPASFYFAKLMEANVDFHDRDMSKSASTEPDARILYNIGVQEMQAKNFSRAFDTLYRCAYTMHNNPYVWIRLTECCIAENERLTALNKQQKNVASVYVESKLEGIFVQKVILPATQNVTGLPLMSPDRHQQKHSNSPTNIGPQCSVSSSSEFVRSSSLPFTLPSMSLETANQCIQNAISLLSRQSAPSSIMLLNALQKSAYIHLLVKNYAAAFNTCQQILSDPHCSRETRAKIQVYLSVANQYL